MKSLVTVIVATYNGEKYIKDQLNSILCQSFQDFTILVCDDCSTDNTVNILRKFEMEHPQKIKVIINRQNIGFIKNFEKLISYSEGSYIAFSDQDDVWTCNHLELLVSKIGTNDAICANSLLVNEAGCSMSITMRDIMKIQEDLNGRKRILIRLMHENFSQGATMLVKTPFVKSLIPFPNGLKYHDYWIAIHAALKNGLFYEPSIVLYYRQHGSNITRNFKSSIFREIYNAQKGRIREHSNYQYNLIKMIDMSLLNDIDKSVIKEALDFHKSIKDQDVSFKTKKYFRDNYEDIFLTKKLYFLRYFEYFIM